MKPSTSPSWQPTLETARSALAALDQARADLTSLGDAATADIARFLRVETGIELDQDAIRATSPAPTPSSPSTRTKPGSSTGAASNSPSSAGSSNKNPHSPSPASRAAWISSHPSRCG